MGQVKAASAIITNKPVIEPYLDEYGIAADFLREQGVPQYDVVADSLIDMRQRVLDLFINDVPNTRFQATQRVIVRDGWAYATDMRIMIRVRTSEPDSGEDFDSTSFLKAARKYISEWESRQGGTWRPWPSDFSFDTKDPWAATVAAAERKVALPLAQRISLLPNVEYLDDTDDYIGLFSQEPLQFRFRCGQGYVMPMSEGKS